MTTYKIIEAHSGTNNQEIEKAKRHFRKMRREKRIYSTITDHIITIRFNDNNYVISAEFHNEFYQEVCDRCVIYEA